MKLAKIMQMPIARLLFIIRGISSPLFQREVRGVPNSNCRLSQRGIHFAALTIFLVCLGCAGETNTTESKGTIGVSLMNLQNPFFKVIGDTVNEEAEKAGYKVVVLGADENAAKQDDQVKDFIAADVAALIIAPKDSQAIATAIEAAAKAGIPVFTVDNACATAEHVTAHVATDNFMGGRQAGQAMIRALGSAGGKVAVLDKKDSDTCIKRVDGFKQVIDEHNKTAENKIEIVVELPSNGDRQTGHASTQDILQSHADIAGVFAINDPSALGCYAALVEAKKQNDVVIIGFDGQPQGKEAIRDGKIFADPVQFPDRMARMTVQLMLKHFDGETFEREILIPTEIYDKAAADADPDMKR